MTTIKKLVSNKPITDLHGKTGKIKYWVDKQEDSIEIKIYSTEVIENESKDIVILWDIIKLSELQKKPGFVDQTLWTRISLDYEPVSLDSEPPHEYIPNDLDEYNIIDIFGKNLISKPKMLSNPSSDTVNSLYSIFVPDSNNFLSCIIRLTIDSTYEAGFEVEGPSASSFVDEHVNIQDLVAPITLTSTQSTVTANSSIVVTVSSAPYIDEVYLENVSGILNKSRVKLTNGQGKFSIITTDLEVGDEVRVKAGHRKWTGIASFSKQIS